MAPIGSVVAILAKAPSRPIVPTRHWRDKLFDLSRSFARRNRGGSITL
jgi:hypothetical protein